MTNTLHSYKSKGDMYAHSLGYLFEEKDWININQALILYTNNVIDLEEKLSEQAEQDSWPSKPACEDDKKVYDTIANNYLSQTEQAEPNQLADASLEPVAWGYFDADGSFMDALDRQHGAYQTPLYAAPVRTKDLTVSELDAIIEKHYDDEMDLKAMILDGIAADREKNK